MSFLSLTQRLRQFAARPTVRDILKVLTGNVAGNGLYMIAMLVLGSVLGRTAFGLFYALQIPMLLIAQLSDFGLNTSIVKYYRDLTEEGRTNDAEALMRRALWLRLAIAGAMTLFCIALAGPISVHWLNNPELAGLFRWACIGSLGTSLWMFCQASMQARQRFGLYAGLTTGNHVLRLILIVAFALAGRMTVGPAVAIMIFVPFVGSFAAAALWPRAIWTARMAADAMRRQVRSILHLSKWIFLSAIVTSLIMRLDATLLELMANEDEVAWFGMAERLAQAFPLITAALSAVLLPKLAATRDRDEMLRIFGLFMRAVPFLIAGAIMTMAAGHLLIPLIRGGEFARGAWVFDMLVLSFSISVVVNPLSFFCLAFDRARWLTWMNLAQLILNGALDLLLIPVLGALAAGVSTLSVRVFALVWLALAFRRLLALAEPKS